MSFGEVKVFQVTYSEIASKIAYTFLILPMHATFLAHLIFRFYRLNSNYWIVKFPVVKYSSCYYEFLSLRSKTSRQNFASPPPPHAPPMYTVWPL
jgi:cephalosporin-C deacetylase-like acetyl esterase